MFRAASRAIGFATLVASCSFNLIAQGESPKHPPRPIVVGPAKWEPLPQEISAAYWTLEPGWNTTLELRNNVRYRELVVTPVLRTPAGQEIALAPVTVASENVVALDLRDLALGDKNSGNYVGSFGSVVFRFSGLNASNLFAAAIVRREGHPIDFHFDAAPTSAEYKMAGIEGVWWLPAQSSDAYLILGNPSKQTVAGSVVLSASSSNRRIPLSIEPGRTARLDLRQALGASNIGAAGGLTIALPSPAVVSATEIVFDETTGLTAMMKLFEREPGDHPAGHTLTAPMMALRQPDAGLGFPEGTTLNPMIFLRNATASPQQVSLSVNWRSQTKSGTITRAPIMLSPQEVTVLPLNDPKNFAQVPADANWGTVKLSYVGNDADLIPVALSYDKQYRYGLQTPFSDALSRLWAGGMWHVDSTHNTLITTGNGGSEPTAAEATLFYNGGVGKYRIEKMLAPGQQLWLDLGHLVHDQIPDSDGHTMPPDTMSGSYELRDLDHATIGELYEGKLVIDKTYGHAAYGCGSCCGYNSVVLDPDPFAGPPDEDNDDYIYATDTCVGDQEDVTGDGYDWGSSDVSVATLPTRTLHTVAVGSATGSSLVQLQASRPPKCAVTTFASQQPISVGQSMTLVGTNCNANPSVAYGGNYANSTSTCFLPSNVDGLPLGGSCVQVGNLPGTTSPKTCYQTNTNNCQITYCMNNSRVANKACTGFLDLGGYTGTKVPAGCN